MKADQTNTKTQNDPDRKAPVRKTEITLEFPLLDIESMDRSKEDHTDCSKNPK